MKIRMPAVECNYYENKLTADRLYSNDEWIWYRQVLCANSFTSLAELRLHRAEEPALDCPIAEGRVSVKGGEAACEAHHGVSVCSWIRKHHCQQFVEIR